MNDTIAAVSTALGEGGIAIIRISGSDAVNISRKVLTRKNFDEPGKMYLTSLIDDDGNIIDRVLAVYFARPRSYTGEDIVEIHTHGGMFIARLCLELVMKNGARLAEPGEFTRRAFVNSRIDLAQAEGVLSLIKSRSIEAVHAAARTLTGELSRAAQKIHDDILALQSSVEIQLDFPEGETLRDFDVTSGIEAVISELDGLIARCDAGMILRDGVSVVIAGSPNAGKSSLMNAILGRKRAIVTDIPGTTRDVIGENIMIDGLPVMLSDTAGIREASDVVEAEGVRLALDAVSGSDICLYVVDSTRELTEQEKKYISSLNADSAIIVLNKSDVRMTDVETECRKVHVSAKELTGIEELKREIYDMAAKNSVLSSGLNVSAGQLAALRESLSALREAHEAAFTGEDVTAGLLQSSRLAVMRVLGLDAGEELLDAMFSRFCVGK